jgi:hypothetical protein
VTELLPGLIVSCQASNGKFALTSVLWGGIGNRVKGTARRTMSPGLAIRFKLLMTLMPDADYAGDLEAPWNWPHAWSDTWAPGAPEPP